MKAPPGLRHRLPLLLFVAGAVFVAFNSWIELKLATDTARRGMLAHAADLAERGRDGLAPAWPGEPQRARLYLFEMASSQPNLRIVALLGEDGRLVECEPPSLRGARLDSLLGLPRQGVIEAWRQPDGANARMLRDQFVFATSRPLAGTGAGVRFACVLDTRARFAAITRDVHSQAVPGAAFGLAIIVALAWMLERWLHVPSNRLRSAAARFAAGDLGARAHLAGDDEFARAGAAFDRMADEVERTERELMAARARLDGVLGALPVGVSVVAREDGRVLYLNSRLRELAGVPSAGDLEYPELTNLLDVRDLDGTPIPGAEQATARALATGRPVTMADHILVRPDGEHVPHVAQAVPISLAADGEYDAVVTIVQDQRELLRLSEEVHLWKHRYERVVEATGQVVYEWDLATGMMMSSSNHQSVLGYVASGRDSLRATWRARLHPDDAERATSALEHCVRTGEPYDAEYRLRHDQGRWNTVRDRGFFDLDADGRPVRMYGTMADVTAQREVEAQLLQAQKMETIGTLAGGIAHDFNNQLTGVIGHLDLLHDTLLPGDASLEHLRIARAAAQRCADLTRGLLAFSRRIESRPQPTFLNALVEETARLLRHALPVTVKMDTELAPSLPPAQVDPGQIQQALLNLCLNASDAMPAGGRIRVATRAVRGEGDRALVELSVSDTGAGIPPEVRLRMFEPFFTTKPVGKGTGLGLSMVYGIVTEHGGRIEVDSRPGEGACFRLLLPVAAAAEAAPAEPPERRTARPGRGECVLVVDDEPVVRSLAVRALELGGYRVLAARDGDEAETLLSQHASEVRAVLLDVMMPGRTGLQVLPELRRISPGLRVVLTSGYSTAPARDVDPDTTFLPKPFSPLALIEAVRTAVAAERTSRA